MIGGAMCVFGIPILLLILSGIIRKRKPIHICKGTRQGGLSSPFIFNIFYKDLVSGLNDLDCGIVIANSKFNVF